MYRRARLIPILMSLLLLACSGSSPSAPPGPAGAMGPGSRPAGPLPVTIALARGTPWTPTLELGATLAPWDTVTVTAEVTGKLSRLSVDLGDRVRRGEKLGEISPEELTWTAEKVEAEANLAEATLKRLEALVASSSATPQELDQAKAAAERARAEARLARKRVADATVRAPFDGWISAREATAGDYLQVGRPIVTVTAAHPLRLRIEVPEKYADRIRPGTPIQLPAGVGAEQTVTISRVSPLVDVKTRTFTAEAKLPNPEGTLKAGSFARVYIELEAAREVATVPESALSTVAGAHRVFEIRESVARAHPVTVLGRLEGQLQLEGISPGTLVAVSGVSRLYDGAKVTPVQDQAASSAAVPAEATQAGPATAVGPATASGAAAKAGPPAEEVRP